jgi:hypothetical protein
MSYCCGLAQALLELSRDAEAEEWLGRGRASAPDESPSTQMAWRQTQAKILARRGELDTAEGLAREAVALARDTDMLDAHATALLDLAEVMELGGRDAPAELEEALALFERKGNLVMAERARVRLAR